MPHALEFPRMLRPVVPLVRGERLAALRRRIVDKLVALAFGHSSWRGRGFARRRAGLYPRFATIVGALNHLPEPVARLRGEDAIRINRRAFQVINRPARKKRAVDVPLFALAVRRQNERAFARAHQYAYFAHLRLLVVFRVPLKSNTATESTSTCLVPAAIAADMLALSLYVNSLHLQSNISAQLRRQTFHPTTGAQELCTCLRDLERPKYVVQALERGIQADFHPRPCLPERKTSSGPSCDCPDRSGTLPWTTCSTWLRAARRALLPCRMP